MSELEAHRAVEAVWRLESARIVAGLTRIVRDVGLAEDLAQEALVAALRQWPESGIPPNPGAWLMATAKHHAIDRMRRDERLRRNVDLLGHDLLTRQQAAVFGASPEIDAVADEDFVPDDVLRLMFVACHPVLSAEARAALTLRLLGGLSTGERAVAVGMAFGPARGLELADALTSRPELRNYHLLPSIRADFLAKLGRQEESRAEFARAASLTRNAAERTVLLNRAAGRR